MQNVIAGIKKEWKVYIMAVWMIGVTGFLIHLNGVIQKMEQTGQKLSSDVDSVESVLLSTDNNVQEIKKLVNEMSAKVSIIHKRIRRR